MVHIVVLGNVGCGKTTFVGNLVHELGAGTHAVFEPIDKWRELQLTEKLYTDMRKWAFPFQLHAFSSRLIEYLDVPKGVDIIVSDGHVLIDREVFAEALHSGGHIDNEQMQVYNETFKQWQKLVPVSKPDVWIWINTPPEVCNARKCEREGVRPEEGGITPEYLISLGKRVDDMAKNLIDKGEIVIEVDGSMNKDEVFQTMMILHKRTEHTPVNPSNLREILLGDKEKTI